MTVDEKIAAAPPVAPLVAPSTPPFLQIPPVAIAADVNFAPLFTADLRRGTASELDPFEFTVLHYLRAFVSGQPGPLEGKAFPGVPRLARLSNMSETKVYEALNRLEKLQRIERTKGTRNTKPLYSIIDHFPLLDEEKSVIGALQVTLFPRTTVEDLKRLTNIANQALRDGKRNNSLHRWQQVVVAQYAEFFEGDLQRTFMLRAVALWTPELKDRSAITALVHPRIASTLGTAADRLAGNSVVAKLQAFTEAANAGKARVARLRAQEQAEF